jgi:hypothetical protein
LGRFFLPFFSKEQCASVSLTVSSPHYPKASTKGDRAKIEARIEVIPMRRYLGIMHGFAGVDLRSDRI